ncbi:MAG: hypothetical protein CMJ36_00560 [Phycisphaerae bacterium]|nr:hypothetical protein [Phycisphaerae bacterium]
MILARCVALVPIVMLVLPASGQSAVPPPRPLSPVIQQLHDDRFLTDAERMELHRLHGTWDVDDLVEPVHRAQAALLLWQLDNPVFDDASVPPIHRALAASRRGERVEALAMLEEEDSIEAGALRGRLLVELGRFEEAARLLDETLRRPGVDAPGQVARVRAGRSLALLQGQTGEAYQALLGTLANAREEHDPLYWEAMLEEADMLLEKHRFDEAVTAAWEVLELNPRASRAWWLLGRVAIGGFDFDGAERAAVALRSINEAHPLATLLEVESALVRRDIEQAMVLLEPLLERYPSMPPALELAFAAEAMRGDAEAIEAAASALRTAAPGDPRAFTTAGRLLSLHRQYEEADHWLGEAISLQANWPVAHVERGLMRWQAGRDADAMESMRRAVQLDPFNRRAANSLQLLEEMENYATIETPHFTIRFAPGIDEALVGDMPSRLEDLHEQVTGRFNWEPAQRTTIEIFPDHERFAVRVVGMPDLHTVAACTGPVIAMEAPRTSPGQRHRGLYDWEDVILHEYTHTVTLDRTGNRIPLWLTEGLAVYSEPEPGTWSTRLMLADEWHDGTLLEPSELDWGFIRPRRPQDRNLAYAQSWMMVEFLLEHWGDDGLDRLLDACRDQVPTDSVFPVALGMTRSRFHEDFTAWMGERLTEWGLNTQPPLEVLVEQLQRRGAGDDSMLDEQRSVALRDGMRSILDDIGTPRDPGEATRSAPWNMPSRSGSNALDGDEIELLLEVHPAHADLLHQSVLNHLGSGEELDARSLERLERYCEARPSDPLGHRLLAEYWLGRDPRQAVDHVEILAHSGGDDPAGWMELARVHRKLGQPVEALAAAEAAITIDPYNPVLRERVAAFAIEAGDLDVALSQVEALMLLEPNQPRHQKRMEAIRSLQERSGG